ncbi:uncharacterized protein LOC131525804 [Onychostoma macrolepis]|nr:uncharacterized protein LOC131525804 [Onychostoma macrolepis]XP_058609743.1 uncharacterized protein LOC131525804 [Onychostoma macrolepis]XP_058609744.1 uncharacterized protein LOC131525804 [Onychostoma macrolepis]
MAALMGLHPLLVNLYWCLIISLLFIFLGAASLPVEGRKGGSITLPCSLTKRENLSTVLTFGPITAFGAGQDGHFSGRVHKSGSCDLILQDLKTTDAGKYILKVYDDSGLISNSYDVHVNVTLTGQKGEELMFELPREAENVTHLTNAGCTEVWRRGRGVLTDRLTHKNDCLTIKNLSSSDAGLYRVLNKSGGILVTVTVTESSTGSKDKLDSTHEDETHDTGRVPVWVGIVIGVVALVALIVFAIIKSRQQ